jgi:hypothetical protein
MRVRGCIAVATTTAPSVMRYLDFRGLRRHYRTQAHNAKENRCRPHWRAHFRVWSQDIPAERRELNLLSWQGRRDRARAKSSRCLATPALIIRYVFPAYAEDQALRVAGCESTGIPYHLNPYAKNPYSSASGLFQLLDTWWAGKFNPFNALANTRTAYQLWTGSGGSFSRHWAASIGCWS